MIIIIHSIHPHNFPAKIEFPNEKLQKLNYGKSGIGEFRTCKRSEKVFSESSERLELFSLADADVSAPFPV